METVADTLFWGALLFGVAYGVRNVVLYRHEILAVIKPKKEKSQA